MSFTTRRLLSDSTSQYKIPNSLRFRSSATAYLSRTPTVAGNRTTWTWSGWVKMGASSLGNPVFNAHGDQTTITRDVLYFRPDGRLDFFVNGIASSFSGKKVSTSVFRDFGAWYHVVAVYDSTNPTAGDRMRLYVNGDRITTFDIDILVPQNTTSKTNSTQIHRIGVDPFSGPPVDYLDGYLTEINFIDGQALDPLAFGYFSATTGVWTPARYTGTYGTNGFYLKFTDTSSNTATGIGKDSSGNNNNWTPNNISLTAGATYDSMIDTPTPYNDGGYGRGNYAVLNPLDRDTLNGNLNSGNLSYNTSTATNDTIRATISVSTGKWYWEVLCTESTGTFLNTYLIGILNSSSPLSNDLSINGYAYYGRTGTKGNNGIYTAYGSTYTTNDIIGVALDLDAGTITFYKNNISQGVAFSGLTGTFSPAYSDDSLVSATKVAFNFGQRPFAYTPPTGFKTLCTQNLPTPDIINAAQYMAATTYAGTGATRTIANTVNNRSFQPDLVWIKGRSAATDHALYDSVRGATKDLVSNSTAAETTQANGLTTFGSNGFTIGSLAKLNTNAQTYVAWQWKAGDSTVTNTAGTITSQVDANPTAGFSIVSYTGTGTSNPTIGHGLGVVPAMIICKNQDTATTAANDWFVYHSDAGAGFYMLLNKTDARATISGSTQGAIGTSPSASTFTIAAGSIGSLNLNESGDRHIAYCFAEVDGFSKFGSYTGNGSTNGPFIYCGFRPKWMMFKRTNAADNWAILDSGRDALNVVSGYVNPNNSAVEFTQAAVDFTSNGIKIRNAATGSNISGSTYIFAAFAEAPFKYALAR